MIDQACATNSVQRAEPIQIRRLSTIKRRKLKGFTLVEMAFVLLILGLLVRIAVQPLAQLQERRLWQATQSQLSAIQQALFAHLVSYGRLPCPVTRQALSVNVNSVEPGGVENQSVNCTVSTGAVPANVLGLRGSIDPSGALLDSWGNPYLYSVSLKNWTTVNQAASVGVANLSADLVLCLQVRTNNCKGASIRADQIVFVVLSRGADSSIAGQQAENQDGDNYFLVTPSNLIAGEEYDDQVVWGTSADAIYWLLRMGWLP